MAVVSRHQYEERAITGGGKRLPREESQSTKNINDDWATVGWEKQRFARRLVARK